MDLDKTTQAIKALDLTVDDPDFYTRAFSYACKMRKLAYAHDGDNFRRVIAEEYDSLSQRLDMTKIQESCQVRNILKTRRLANLLINDKGDLNTAALPKLINLLQQHLHSLGPNRQYDSPRQEHLLKVLNLLNDNKEVVCLLKSIDKPLSHKYADQIIRDTLQLPTNTPVTDAHARRAVLSALLGTLRQNIGSCFATAPSIIIHDEQPEMFLKDVAELLNTGRLKRTFGGVEYSVPLSSSWGGGDLKKPFLLPIGEGFDASRIWLSPGLEAAFQAGGLIDPEKPAEERAEQIKTLLNDLLSNPKGNPPILLTSMEELIRNTLLYHFHLTESDITDYINRPQAMIMGGLAIHSVSAGKTMGGKGQQCANFLEALELACKAFKSLADNALLKAWEFSIASLSETKSQFTRWNLYASLGLGPQEAGGIGQALYNAISIRLEQANRRVQELHEEYENLFHQLKTMESRMRSVSTEKEAQWLRAEYQSRRNEFYTFEEMRDAVNKKAHALANLYDVLIDQYDSLFPRYFQEVYDADMHDVNVGPYDDSPAGFRLLYKHGRANTAQWTAIKTPNEFIDCLVSFFTSTEREIASLKGLEQLETELAEITTAIVGQIRSKEFLESAFYRMAAAHRTHIVKDPLDHLDKVEKKPWAYTSGGTMNTLVSCYFKLENPPTEVSRWVESPTELLTFLCETLSRIPPKLTQEFIEEANKSMLIHSPTHAFLLKPGAPLFKNAWTSDAFTYTWIRDNFIQPRKQFIESLWLDEAKMHYLIQKLAASVPDNFRHYFNRVFGSLKGQMRPKEFRDHILATIKKERGLKEGQSGVLSADEIDSTLFTLLPLFSREDLEERLHKIYAKMPSLTEESRTELKKAFEIVPRTYSQETVLDAAKLQDIAKGLICLAFEESTSPLNIHEEVAAAAQALGYALPTPIVFADTNWIKDLFSFVVNPGTGRLELWRTDTTGRAGSPMSHWEQWLDGSRKDIPWGIYTKPYEYKVENVKPQGFVR